MGAGGDASLPAGYWQHPAAMGAAPPPDHWSQLEANLHPEACAQCHADRFGEWMGSRHARAFSAGLIGQFPVLGLKKASGCLVCHAPLQEQQYSSLQEMQSSLPLALESPDGFNPDADVEHVKLPLRHAGVTCAACHVRGWARFGPPARGTAKSGLQPGVAHSGFTATPAFEQSSFCAGCHQFSAAAAVNGKPLENTLSEWKNSDYGRRSVTCQQCHMPDRRHEFRGIHDADMVRKGLQLSLHQRGHSVVLRLVSTWIGHAFPTYVTPKVIVEAEAVDGRGAVVRRWHWEIWRKLAYDHGWQELLDTRLMPGEAREFIATPLSASVQLVRYRITVIPDHYYKGLYRQLSASNHQREDVRSLIQRAAAQADANDYTLFEGQLRVEVR